MFEMDMRGQRAGDPMIVTVQYFEVILVTKAREGRLVWSDALCNQQFVGVYHHVENCWLDVCRRSVVMDLCPDRLAFILVFRTRKQPLDRRVRDQTKRRKIARDHRHVFGANGARGVKQLGLVMIEIAESAQCSEMCDGLRLGRPSSLSLSPKLCRALKKSNKASASAMTQCRS